MFANCQWCHPILSLLLPGSSTETLDPNQNAQLLVKRKHLKPQKTPPDQINKGMASPAPTLADSQPSTAHSSGLNEKPSKENVGDVKRPLFQEELPERKKRTSKKQTEVDAGDVEKPKEAGVPEVTEPKPKRRAATKSKAQPQIPPAAEDPQKVKKPVEKDVKIKTQHTTDSLGAAVQDALNRSGTTDHAEANPKEEGEKGNGEEKELSKKQLKEKRDLVAHARKMRFYRSLSSLKLSM